MLPLICYEAIFPGDVVDATTGRAGSSTSPTTAGLEFRPALISICSRRACVRIEQGLPLVRAANTGISAVIDPLGRVVARLDLGLEGVLDFQSARRRSRRRSMRAPAISAAIIVAVALIFVIRAGRNELPDALIRPPVAPAGASCCVAHASNKTARHSLSAELRNPRRV